MTLLVISIVQVGYGVFAASIVGAAAVLAWDGRALISHAPSPEAIHQRAYAASVGVAVGRLASLLVLTVAASISLVVAFNLVR
jgi:hypothetical protein